MVTKRKILRAAAALCVAAVISAGSTVAVSAEPTHPEPATSTGSTETSTEKIRQSLEASVEGVSPALVIDRTVEEDNDVLTETTTLDTGDVFTSVLDRPTSILKAYYNGRLVNEVNLDVVFEEMVVSEGGPSAVQSRS